MDRLIYTAMTGAKHAFMQQAGTANNLANASTIGFKAQEHRFRAVEVQGEGMPTRAFAVDASVADVFDEGPLMFSGRSLDVAVQGRGWLAVRLPDGSEAYTRAGSLDADVNGELRTKSGHTVLGDGGPITIPPDNNVEIAPDGTVSVISTFGTPNNVNPVGRLKLVNPPEGDLVRGADGLFRMRNGQPAQVDENVRVVSGALEGSNVNVTDAMVNLISLSRQFELQIKMMQTADQNAQRADQLLSLNG
ncbi:flagellar basal-body rod protein FlgF [Azonexus fungiphilus]|jgi:flagellar basal-body rod protein FlgF|uniref:Flagellar basal-body rod protein FlgF n=1 Tax=Azonexus fungiphilus TaxID=146940 RepID=A0A495VLX2_9RHOO|nr:flagellar basal body rod protein FlgF [Azonexus fungiphilus]NHC07224.1 flagellar basal body rod protein FlgF [Azonexus fungiphilus]RKT50401.1 flagellar basal-body rod protein FlgF [Azonexus fungiphilus]